MRYLGACHLQEAHREVSGLMAEKSTRRQRLEQSLGRGSWRHVSALRPGDAMLARGRPEGGSRATRSLIADHPEDQVVAYQQLGPIFAETGETEAAMSCADRIVKAKARGDWHAAPEMEQLAHSLQ